jgi:hypothetical protein
MDYVVIVSMLAAIAVVAVVAYIFSRNEYTADVATIVSGESVDGRHVKESSVVPVRSVNEKEGLTFSYTCWLKVNNFEYRYGEQKVVFTKGPKNLSAMCPALFIDGNTNALLVKIDTFGTTEIIPINDISAKKWVHIAIVVEQNSVDVYVNGTLHTHHTLLRIPRQNDSPVFTGVDGGFDGSVSSIFYYNRYLNASQIQSLMKGGPMRKEVEVLPPYSGISWWTRAS